MRYLSSKYHLATATANLNTGAVLKPPTLSFDVLKAMETEFNKDMQQHYPIAVVPAATGIILPHPSSINF